MDKNLLDASANELFALAASFIGYIGNTYSQEDLAILSGFFVVVGDALSLYAAVLAKQASDNSCDLSDSNENKKNT